MAERRLPRLSELPVLSVLPSAQDWPLHGVAASRRIEKAALASHPSGLLMARAGLAVARLAAALQPHGSSVWLLAGPGNNGGDALVAATHLKAWGWQVQVSLLGQPQTLPADAHRAWQQALAAGVPVHEGLLVQVDADLCIDGLLGLGVSRPPSGALAEGIRLLNRQSAPVLAIDLPSGLAGDTGAAVDDLAVRASHTLSLLTLKPGLFTAQGRDLAGRVWLDRLGLTPGKRGDLPGAPDADAWLAGPPSPPPRLHAHHKGSFGDLLVLGGAPGMGGAALLAARAALQAGAGRVFLGRLGQAHRPDDDNLQPDPQQPELMTCRPGALLLPERLARLTVVLGCGGGDAVQATMPLVLQHAARLVLDADALNALAGNPALWDLLCARHQPTVLTPHPLEAARLLACSTQAVQADRLAAAQALAERGRATVVLKGSGTVVAAPGRPPWVVPTGNARLGTGGTGDVLAGWLGGWLAGRLADWPGHGWVGEAAGQPDRADSQVACSRQVACTQQVACAAAWLHGHAADMAPGPGPLPASQLIKAMAAALGRLPPPN